MGSGLQVIVLKQMQMLYCVMRKKARKYFYLNRKLIAYSKQKRKNIILTRK